MTKLNIIAIDNINYYKAEDIYNSSPNEFKYINKSAPKGYRTIINNHSLDENDYLYGYIQKNKWIKSHNKYSHAILLLSTTWTHNNIKYFKKTNIIENNIESKEVDNINIENNDNIITNTMIESNIIVESKTDNIFEVKEQEDNEQPIIAPDILHLEEHEMFKDNDGNIYDIEIRGIRQYDKCYFRLTDVSKSFNMPFLLKNLTDKRYSVYKYGIHYVKLQLNNIRFKNGRKTDTFLTYEGFSKIIYSTTKKHNNHYVMKKWLENFDKTIMQYYNIIILPNILIHKDMYI